jgi:hypothetical protein
MKPDPAIFRLAAMICDSDGMGVGPALVCAIFSIDKMASEDTFEQVKDFWVSQVPPEQADGVASGGLTEEQKSNSRVIALLWTALQAEEP